ncbi:MAG: (2Fe-2S)-binding protein [Clostridia bacterium]|nr:(2Fe-2S)-binding protein [Clostridia bacterium]
MAIVEDVCGNIEPEFHSTTCPVCHEPGQKVKDVTLRSLLKEDKLNKLLKTDYFLCLSQECPTSYYTKDGTHFTKEDLTVPIWYKEESPVPICYCKGVTDEVILEHVVNKKCCTNLAEIKAHTGANTGKECLTKNPTGR